jgi:hypothetical protein
MSRKLSVGRSVLVTGVFRDAAGELFDPSSPAIRAKRDGMEQTRPALSRTKPDGSGASDGHYYAVVVLSAAGEWRFRAESLDAAEAAPSPVSVIVAEADDF